MAIRSTCKRRKKQHRNRSIRELKGKEKWKKEYPKSSKDKTLNNFSLSSQYGEVANFGIHSFCLYKFDIDTNITRKRSKTKEILEKTKKYTKVVERKNPKQLLWEKPTVKNN